MNLFEIIGYPLFVVSVLEIILGLILLKYNPRNSPVNKALAAFSLFAAAYALVTSFMYILASYGLDITVLARANWIGWLMIPAGIQFIYYMRDENSRAAGVAGAILYPFWLIVLCVSVSTNLIESGNYTLIPYIDRSGPLGKPLRVLGIVQLFWVMYELLRLRRQASGIRRAQLNYFMHGMLIFAGGGTLVAGVFQLFGGFGLEPGLGSYFSLPWVALTAYAVTRYRLFDIRTVISRALSFVLLSVIIIGSHLVLFKLFEPALGPTFAILVSLTLIGLAVLGTTFSRKVQAWIKSAVMGDKHDYQKVLGESIKAIATILNLDDLLQFIINSMKKSLNVDGVGLFLKEKNGQYGLRVGFSVHERIAGNRSLHKIVVDRMRDTKRVVIREELEAGGPGDAGTIPYLKEIGAEAVIPLICRDRLQGVLTLGRKNSGEPFTPVDIDLLEALAIQAAVSIENAVLYEQMEEKVRERTRELDEARKVAEAANKAKSEFLSNITHELRTPLNSIIGFSEVMREGTAGPLLPDQQAYLKDIWESGKHLLRIINNILDLSKIEAGMMELEHDEFYLKELLDGSLSLFREKAQRKRITLVAEISDNVDMITADKTKIKQVTLNLLANAMKFTPDGGSVGIAASRNNAGVQVHVWDTGIGMSPGDCGRLFQPFLQLDNTTTRKYEGTGLGLHLSRKIIELHGGRIWVESAPGAGSRFSFTIPRAAVIEPGQDHPDRG